MKTLTLLLPITFMLVGFSANANPVFKRPDICKDEPTGLADTAGGHPVVWARSSEGDETLDIPDLPKQDGDKWTININVPGNKNYLLVTTYTLSIRIQQRPGGAYLRGICSSAGCCLES